VIDISAVCVCVCDCRKPTQRVDESAWRRCLTLRRYKMVTWAWNKETNFLSLSSKSQLRFHKIQCQRFLNTV